MKRLIHSRAALCRKAARGGDAPVRVFFSPDKELVPEEEVKSVRQVWKEQRERAAARYAAPSRAWLAANAPSLLGQPWFEVLPRREDWLAAGLWDSAQGRFHMRPGDLAGTTLQIGDLCVLSAVPGKLVVCVEQPTDAADARYAFAGADGAVCYATKSDVRLRVPGLHKRPLRYLLHREADHGYAPVGTVKNNISRTYLLPVAVRRLFAALGVTEISQQAVAQLPEVVAKLELLHRHLQSHLGPWQLSLFKLVDLVTRLELPNSPGEASEKVAKLLAELNIGQGSYCSAADINLRMAAPKQVDIALYLATYWGVLQQQGDQMWGDISYHRALFSPLSVTVLPLRDQTLFYDYLLRDMKRDDYAALDEFACLVNQGKYKEACSNYKSVLQLLRDYCAGNINSNAALIYLVTRLFRRLDAYKEEEVTRTIAFQLLGQLCPETPHNPLHWNHQLELPLSNPRTALEQKVYDLASPPLDQEEPGPRKEFSAVCYCIDSPDAHEIDDGVSIERLKGSRYRLHVHIADPSSLFKKSFTPGEVPIDPVMDIAFRRAFTTYLPDLVFPMMPKSYTRASDLGQWDKPTKTITISVDVDLSKKLRVVDEATLQIALGTTRTSKRVTYDYVDDLLESKRQDAEASDLRLLYKVAESLREERKVLKHAIMFGDVQNGLISLTPNEDGKLLNVQLVDSKSTKSNTLVSELMIMANSLAGRYFHENTIPGVYRGCTELLLKFEASNQYASLQRAMRQKGSVSSSDLVKVAAFLTNSHYSSTPCRHAMVGTEEYLTITSPLRRLPDMINHMQLHRHLRSLPPCFSQEQIDALNWHILARDVALKDASKRSSVFWTLGYLKDQLCAEPDKRWDLVVTSLPLNGFVHCKIPGIFYSSGKLKIPSGANNPAVGSTVANCFITRLDSLDGTLRFEMKS
ncbi:AFR448Wp [Eremothecium gossypii ATCC 10895]|uniref:AFR448Wp n=1 Tax=Eremothecium gossypii (strain ATCC 10895 / CBS 109.51 / FGSC 9923 / NRRL Y-1056) TaxID=284811 RepID=Q752X5_EREGS|nr:AFR448Wp [Eremothecium gossypii ATCC 10895]AAS53819.2 AFR448Wp [Eremothecium gossypii ATCC 10895]AEY98130.1 FAFR448Wp [Eremothecium gossypii FDAG1]